MLTASRVPGFRKSGMLGRPACKGRQGHQDLASGTKKVAETRKPRKNSRKCQPAWNVMAVRK